MAIIIETCPKCGHDLHDVILAVYPPIPKKKCLNCNWEWMGEPEQVLRVPFGDNSFYVDGLRELHGDTDYGVVATPLNDTSCAVNNVNRYAFTVSRNDLDTLTNACKISHDDIIKAIERTKPYIKEE